MNDPNELRPGRRGFRRGLLILSVFVSLVAVYLLRWSQAGFPSTWRLIRKGMIRAEVEALTGSRIDSLIADQMWDETYKPSLFVSKYEYYLAVVFAPPAYSGAEAFRSVVSVQVYRFNHFASWLESIRDPNVIMRSQLDPSPPAIYEIK